MENTRSRAAAPFLPRFYSVGRQAITITVLREVQLFLRALLVALMFSLPFDVHAASYLVHPGDTLSGIASRYRVSMRELAQVNGISNVDIVQVGRVLVIPVTQRALSYHVRWGDTLSGIAARFGLSISTIRALNPNLGEFLLTGQWLRLCHPCSSGNTVQPGYTASYSSSSPTSTTYYTVQPGDTLSGIASRYGVTVSSILLANNLADANRIVIGAQLAVPQGGVYDPGGVRSLITSYALRYGISPSLALAVAWQESGFNQSMISSTGAIGVMQVEPYTGSHIADLWGRPVNLYNVDENIHAGVFWLYTLLAYYGGDQRLAVAAYYQGTRNLARYGLFSDTVQYVNNVFALSSRF